ncbi:uncharacterized protein LOC129601834 [Paramacrobiotus metropolitanus]|uniref:uncharacterized protein LOC129601834 n=1 Tax=Paramacrobiotus metropolitanus TaxID=2943436 RepID=UPI002445D1F2|nr:uncharacterized protein LOC129601834 [Paramacrobiotus metropolitanus]
MLILGDEVDAGKSIWISGFAKSFRYSSFDEALVKPGIPISLHFEILDHDFRKHVVSAHCISAGDDTVSPEDTITLTKYHVNKAGRFIRMLNAPSVHDGINAAEIRQIAEAICKYLVGYNELHGICILLKSRTGMTPALYELVNTLLSRLHCDVICNIVFIFTDAGSPLNLPVDTLAKLQQWKNAGVEINQETLYCYDNDVFRFRLAVENGVQFCAAVTKHMSGYWTIAVQEATRLVAHIFAVFPYTIRATFPISKVRKLFELHVFVEIIAAEARYSDYRVCRLPEEKDSETANMERYSTQFKGLSNDDSRHGEGRP